jgi:hypothetical protein
LLTALRPKRILCSRGLEAIQKGFFGLDTKFLGHSIQNVIILSHEILQKAVKTAATTQSFACPCCIQCTKSFWKN